MRRRLYLPDEVRAEIQEHIRVRIEDASLSIASAVEDEDSMTGHLGAKLQIGWQSVDVLRGEIPGTWRWAVDYKKFRGRGKGATERFLGADGIFELKLDSGYRTDTKTLLFQAKSQGRGGTPLFVQCMKLSTWREAAFVIDYRPGDLRALSLDDVIASRGRIDSEVPTWPLATILSEDFLDCVIGDTTLSYDAVARRLSWRAMSGELVATDFGVGHRLRVGVRAPKHQFAASGVDRIVRPEDAHNYRMEAAPTEIATYRSSQPPRTGKDSKNRLAVAYHPDLVATINQELADLATRRMQEINDSYEPVKPRRERGPPRRQSRDPADADNTVDH